MDGVHNSCVHQAVRTAQYSRTHLDWLPYVKDPRESYADDVVNTDVVYVRLKCTYPLPRRTNGRH